MPSWIDSAAGPGWVTWLNQVARMPALAVDFPFPSWSRTRGSQPGRINHLIPYTPYLRAVVAAGMLPVITPENMDDRGNNANPMPIQNFSVAAGDNPIYGYIDTDGKPLTINRWIDFFAMAIADAGVTALIRFLHEFDIPPTIQYSYSIGTQCPAASTIVTGLDNAVAQGATTIVWNTQRSGFVNGQKIVLNAGGANEEIVTLSAGAATLNWTITATAAAHVVGESVITGFSLPAALAIGATIIDWGSVANKPPGFANGYELQIDANNGQAEILGLVDSNFGPNGQQWQITPTTRTHAINARGIANDWTNTAAQIVACWNYFIARMGTAVSSGPYPHRALVRGVDYKMIWNVTSGFTVGAVQNAYPGSANVDYLGLDTYVGGAAGGPPGQPGLFDFSLTADYNNLMAIDSTKQVIICEGSIANDQGYQVPPPADRQSAYIKAMAALQTRLIQKTNAALTASYPQLIAYCLFNLSEYRTDNTGSDTAIGAQPWMAPQWKALFGPNQFCAGRFSAAGVFSPTDF